MESLLILVKPPLVRSLDPQKYLVVVLVVILVVANDVAPIFSWRPHAHLLSLLPNQYFIVDVERILLISIDVVVPKAANNECITDNRIALTGLKLPLTLPEPIHRLARLAIRFLPMNVSLSRHGIRTVCSSLAVRPSVSGT